MASRTFRPACPGEKGSLLVQTKVQFYSCHTLASYASFDAVPFTLMQTTMVGQRSRKLVIFAVYEGKTHHRPTSLGIGWLGFESLPLRHFPPLKWEIRSQGCQTRATFGCGLAQGSAGRSVRVSFNRSAGQELTDAARKFAEVANLGAPVYGVINWSIMG